MLRDERRVRLRRTVVSGILSSGTPLALFATLLALQGGESPPAAPVLVVVPPGSNLAVIEKVRSAVRAPRRALLVADSDRVVLEGGFEMLVDRSFARAPAADALVLVDGKPGPAEESFLMDRRKTAKAILLPPGSALADKVRGEGSGGALILLGGSDSIAALLDALDGTAATRPAAPVATAVARPNPTVPPSTAPTEAPPARTATPPASRVFDRYFSSSRPTPSPTPR
jgi:hypothetical protein